jgi:hypothetical protein
MGREQQTLPPVLQRRFFHAGQPAPGVAEPDLRQDVDARLLGPAIVDRDAHEHVVRVGLGVFDLSISK